MEHISKIIARQQESSEQSTKPMREKMESSISTEHVQIFWKRMTMIYGHKWTSSYGELDDGTWQAGLNGIPLDGIRRGLECVRDSGKEWPPSLPEFRELCKKPVTPFDGTTKRLPKPERTEQEINEGLDYLQQMRKGI